MTCLDCNQQIIKVMWREGADWIYCCKLCGVIYDAKRIKKIKDLTHDK